MISLANNYIKKTRGEDNFNTEVRAALRGIKDGMSFEEMARAPILNMEQAYKSTSILSALNSSQRALSDISGTEVRMIARIGDDVFTDKVIVRGAKTTAWVVEIEGTLYSVAKSCVIFAPLE